MPINPYSPEEEEEIKRPWLESGEVYVPGMGRAPAGEMLTALRERPRRFATPSIFTPRGEGEVTGPGGPGVEGEITGPGAEAKAAPTLRNPATLSQIEITRQSGLKPGQTTKRARWLAQKTAAYDQATAQLGRQEERRLELASAEKRAEIEGERRLREHAIGPTITATARAEEGERNRAAAKERVETYMAGQKELARQRGELVDSDEFKTKLAKQSEAKARDLETAGNLTEARGFRRFALEKRLEVVEKMIGEGASLQEIRRYKEEIGQVLDEFVGGVQKRTTSGLVTAGTPTAPGVAPAPGAPTAPGGGLTSPAESESVVSRSSLPGDLNQSGAIEPDEEEYNTADEILEAAKAGRIKMTPAETLRVTQKRDLLKKRILGG